MAKKLFGSALKDKALLLIAQFCCIVMGFFTHENCSFQLLGTFPEDITFLSPHTFVMDIVNSVVLITMCLFFALCSSDLFFPWICPNLLAPSMHGWGALASMLSALTFSFISMHPKSFEIWASTTLISLLNLGLGLEKLYRGCGLRAPREDVNQSNPNCSYTLWVLYLFGIGLSISKAWFILLTNICIVHTVREGIQVTVKNNTCEVEINIAQARIKGARLTLLSQHAKIHRF